MTADALKKRIKIGMTRKDYSAKYMAVIMHMDRSTWYKRMGNVDKFSFEELSKIDRILNLKLFNEEN